MNNLTRSRDQVFGGVCSGIARHFGLDTRTVRIATVIAAVVLGGGTLLPLAYLVLWVVLPEENNVIVMQQQGNQWQAPLNNQWQPPYDPYATATKPAEPSWAQAPSQTPQGTAQSPWQQPYS